MSDMVLQLRITADGKVAVSEVKATEAAIQGLSREGDKAAAASAKQREELEKFGLALKKKVDTLGMTASQLRVYEAQQLGATRADLEAVAAANATIETYERKAAATARMGVIAARAGLAVGTALVTGLVASVRAGREAEESQLKLEAVLAATGSAAGLSARQLNTFADAMARSTRFDDEEIRNASATLLTFRDVQGSTFKEGLKLAADLSAVFGGGLQSSVVQVGKALQEPVEGITALRRVGVQFTGEQERLIKHFVETNNLAAAQRVILDELANQVGGTAVRSYSGYAKAIGDATKSAGEFFEALGNSAPVRTAVIGFLDAATTRFEALTGAIQGNADAWAKLLTDPRIPILLRMLGTSAVALSAARGASDRQRYLLSDPDGSWNAAEEARLARTGADRQAAARAAAAQADAARKAEELLKRYRSEQEKLNDEIAEFVKQATAAGKGEEYIAAGVDKITAAYNSRKKSGGDLNKELERQARLEQQLAEYHERELQGAARRSEQIERRTIALEDGNDWLRVEIDTMGASTLERELAMLALEEEIALRDELDPATRKAIENLYAERRALLETRAARKEDLERGARKEASLRAMLQAEEREIEQMAQGMGDAVSEAIMQGGIDGAQFIKRLFAQLVLRPIVQPIMQDIVGSLFGSGEQGGGLSGMNLLGNLGNIGSLGMRLMGGAGGGINALGNLLGSSTISQFGAGMAGAVPGTVNFMGPVLPGTTAGTAASFGGEFAAFMSNPVTMAIAAALAIWQSGIFDDGPENPRARLSFGPGSAGSPFGTAGFAMNEGGFDAAAVERFFGSFAGFDRQIARGMSPEQLARIQGRLGAYNTSGRRWDGQPAEFAFPEGDETGGEQLMREFLHQRYSVVFDELGQDLGNLVRVFEGTSEELGAMIQSLYALTEVGQSIDDMILQITGEAVPLLRGQLDALDTAVANAQDDFATALEGTDPAALLQAEQQLSQAVVNRYNTELGMIRSLQDAIASLKDQAYQFSVQMAQRISAAGGTRDVAAIALGRATQLRSGIGGTAPVGAQIRDLNSYVGAIDTWYQARRQEIEAQIAAEQAAMQAIANAQAAAAEARIAALEEELALAEQFKGLAESARGMIDEMRLTAANPLSVHGRLAMSGDDVARLREEYAGASGTARIGAGERLIDALRTRLSLGGEGFQRPSPEYQAIYNEVIAELTAVQASAQSEAERAAELQTQIVELQRQAAAYQGSIASSSAASQGYLDQLNAEARAYYEYAEAEGARLFEEQERQHQEQLDAITGGMEPELYIAQLQSQTVDELKEIRKAIREWLDTVGAIVGAEPGGGAGEGGAGGGRPSPESEQKIVLEVDGQVLGSVIVPTIDKRIRQSGTVIKRAIANA